MMTYTQWCEATGNTGRDTAFDEYRMYQRRESEPRINEGAAFRPARLERDGETYAQPCIEIGGAQVYAYVQDGGLVVSVHLDEAAAGVFALYGEDKCVPLTVSVNGEDIWIAQAPE